MYVLIRSIFELWGFTR